jgi:hypothetical protein
MFDNTELLDIESANDDRYFDRFLLAIAVCVNQRATVERLLEQGLDLSYTWLRTEIRGITM